MTKKAILGLYTDANYAAEAGEALERAGLSNQDFDFLTDTPYPEGALGERHSSHRLYIFPFIGALIGMTTALLLTTATQVSYPLITGGKPVLSVPPMAIITYEGTMLGAILFTVIGIIFESRLPSMKKQIYLYTQILLKKIINLTQVVISIKFGNGQSIIQKFFGSQFGILQE